MRTLLNVTKIFDIFNPACDGMCKALSFGFAQNIFTGAAPLEKRNVPRTAGSSTAGKKRAWLLDPNPFEYCGVPKGISFGLAQDKFTGAAGVKGYRSQFIMFKKIKYLP